MARLDKVVAIRLQSVPMGLLDSKSSEPTQVTSSSKRAKGRKGELRHPPHQRRLNQMTAATHLTQFEGVRMYQTMRHPHLRSARKPPHHQGHGHPKQIFPPQTARPKSCECWTYSQAPDPQPRFLGKRDMRW